MERKETPIEQLERMKGKCWLYNDKEVVIMSYADGLGISGAEVEIYLNNGVVYTDYANLRGKLMQFKPIGKQVMVVANKALDSVSTMNVDTLGQLKSALLSTIREIREAKPGDKHILEKARAIQGVTSTYTNLARTELDYRRYIENKIKG